MRPIRLEMKGFTSFREPVEIDFSGLELFAIVGPTGAGKTSLIDAVVFALFGSTPRISKTVSDLISLGSERLTVLLEFESGGDRYRISRSMRRRSKGSPVSDRRLEVSRDGEWESLADKDREVSELVEKIVGLDFEGFVRSVVLPQGQFDRFLTGERDQRRDILKDLLRLDIYVRMGQKSRQLAALAAQQSHLLRDQLQRDFADATPERAAALEEQLKADHCRLEELRKSLESCRQAELKALDVRRFRQEAAKIEKDLETSRRQLSALEEQSTQAEADLGQLSGRCEDLLQKMQSLGYDEDRLHRLLELAPQAETLAAQRGRLVSRQSDSKSLGGKLEAARGALQAAAAEKRARETELKAVEEQNRVRLEELGDLLRSHGSPDLLRELAGRAGATRILEKEAGELKGDLKELEAEKTQADERLAELSSMHEKAIRAREEADRSRRDLERRHAAASLRGALQPGEPCPVCSQTVPKKSAQRQGSAPDPEAHDLLSEADRLLDDCAAEVRRIDQETATLKGRLQTLPGRVEVHKARLTSVNQQIDDYRSRVRQALGSSYQKGDAAELNALAGRLETLSRERDQTGAEETRLRRQAEASADRANQSQTAVRLLEQQLESVQEQISELESAVALLTKEFSEWPGLDDFRRQLEEQRAAREQRLAHEKEYKRLEEEVRRLEQRRQQLKGERAAAMQGVERLAGHCERVRSDLNESLEELKELAGEWLPGDTLEGPDEADALQARRAGLDQQERRLNAEAARMDAELSQLRDRIAQAEHLREKLKAKDDEAAVAEELGRCLQGDRFITFIQEEAFRRLAEVGTVHLRKLSQERYSFLAQEGDFFVTDHWNADEVRPVNTLSGGETFLASLSLALSLAESLSQLSTEGVAALESLFLDEGFSTLDAETLDIAVSGIESLTAGERLVGVISHLPELADRFPHKIVIEKAVGGSRASVQG